MNKKNLVIFYSLEGNTKFVALEIAKIKKADILQIKPIKEINTKNKFLKYFWGGRQVYMRKTPKLQPFNCDFQKYENIYLGSPVWAWTFAPPLRSFFNMHLIKEKNLYLFCTYENTLGKCLEKFQSLVETDNNKVIKTLSLINPLKNQEQCKNLIKKWLC